MMTLKSLVASLVGDPMFSACRVWRPKLNGGIRVWRPKLDGGIHVWCLPKFKGGIRVSCTPNLKLCISDNTPRIRQEVLGDYICYVSCPIYKKTKSCVD